MEERCEFEYADRNKEDVREEVINCSSEVITATLVLGNT